MSKFSLWSFAFKTVLKYWMFFGKHMSLRVMAILVREGYSVLLLAFLWLKAGSLGEWDLFELLFLQSAISFSYAGFLLFFSELRYFNVSNASSSRLLECALLKPQGVLMQILSCNCDWFAIIGHGILGASCFIVGCLNCQINVNAGRIAIFILNMIGSIAIQAALTLFTSALSFFTTQAPQLKKFLFWLPRLFLRYPLIWFPPLVSHFFVYVVPFAFVSYFPTLFLLGKTDPAYPFYFVYLSLPVGVALYLTARLTWQIGLRRYLNR